MEYIAHADTCVLYDNRVLNSGNHDCCNVVPSDFLDEFDIISLEYGVLLPHFYDANKLLFKINIEIDDANTRKHIITVKTCVNMKKVSNDLPMYKANLKILVPIVKGEFKDED